MQNILEFNNVLAVLLAYFIGSIPSAIWVSKWFFGIDVRDYGSNNAGATNTFRVIGKFAGFTVLFFDILKGWVSVKLLTTLILYQTDSLEFINMQLIVGITAVLGHVFPIYEKFQGGKGVATLMGIILAINFSAAIGCVIIFLVIFIFFSYVSLGAIVAAIFFPIITIFILRIESLSLIYFSIFISILVILTHKPNIYRLLNKDENKMKIKLKKSKNS
ncbi:MAG: glycerol-3-phosphate 1-O-acyltransferase PlsY [Flavobacteriales bacterium]|jgi:glycerol-3-phosphate acyltransferase PlsY|nr:glycerol-3-phosphate 1-O-acyltransferase PlsY [Flavobacteriales bacterium]MDG1440841.1 glycerol-3-phosphate 1-O-acyltransferase PlsY [Flavobacteriales bacterium]MDG1797576.1 glycerol-3-phosphate 1-O-acyltransferase PlsY [Flavobacteriales bacterium]|tara:strand:+ start:74 stop:727 length:654 start_codon:yes stop_codon:yes gene_type:complete